MIFLALCVLQVILWSPQLSSAIRVDLGYATYESDLHLADGVVSFLGIRYSDSPTGQQRWRKPRSPPVVSGVQNTTSNPPQCHHIPLVGTPGRSTNSPFRTTGIAEKPSVCVPAPFRLTYPRKDVAPYSEDCLFLNVHVPVNQKTDSQLPVIVYMHGGGYDAGSATLYPVHDFVTMSNFGVISVAIQYRLGAFGFLPGSNVKEDGDLNVGLLDQEFALQWVQKYFGGDRSRVTIWGQSAGAGSVLQHAVAHGGNTQPPLFRSIIANSPCLLFQYRYDDPIPEALYSAVVSDAGCDTVDDAMKCLRDVDAAALLDAGTQVGASSFLGTFTFVPVVDGTFIMERPTETLQRGQVNGEMVLLTTTANEGALFVNPDAIVHNGLTLHDYARGLFPRLDPTHINELVTLYSSFDWASTVDQATEMLGDSIFLCPTYFFAEAFKRRAWKARLDVAPGFHGQDLSYEFSTFAIPPTVTDPAFLDAFRQSFISLALWEDPGVRLSGGSIPSWPSWSKGHSEMRFDGGSLVIQPFATDEELLERCEFWRSVAAVNAQ
ncbi:alpha/beta-hydrolase [Roridomyces roridus]|uniref:Carboxylic ester hydrolase n=1 Tax=Roridomyces roridus TaxID=1738132 RepID=A0AAD7FN80_9AGAR|nr:alpha/beta-hydrolase [Roridomyces roridus]